MTVLAKQPSSGLIEMIKVAAESLLNFGELWGSIKSKGEHEGFSEKELQEMLRPHLKQKMDSKKIWYLFHKEEQIERVQKKQEENRTKFSTNDVNKDTEQKKNWDEEIEDLGIKKDVPVKDSTEFYKEQEQAEEPTELELANIKIAHLEDALKKTEQFKPATALEAVKQNFEVIEDPDVVFDWLRKRDNKVTCFWYDGCGIGFFTSQILTQLKGGGVKTFKRLYFEV